MSNNIKLECFASVVKGKKGFSIEKDGKTLHREVTYLSAKDLKEGMFLALKDGLQMVKSKVTHEMVLMIVVQNRHVADWLNEMNDYGCNRFIEVSDIVFDLIDELDCKYRVVYLQNYNTKKYVLNNDPVKEKTVGLEDAFNFEEN